MDKLPDETNAQWCDRVAASIPPKRLTEIVMKARILMSRAPKSRRELWSYVGEVSGNGSGVSSAILNRWEAERLAKVARTASVSPRWLIVEDGGGERDFGKNEAAARENLASLTKKGRIARLYRLDPFEEAADGE